MDENQSVSIHKAECSVCGGKRNCDIIGKKSQGDGDRFFSWNTDWYLLQCRGCESIFAQSISTNSEDYDDYEDIDGQYKVFHHETIAYWPALSKRKRPDWLTERGIDADNAHQLSESLGEVYGALNNSLNMLAAIGIRTSFDVASEHLGIKPELSFRNKLKNLVKDGHISKVDETRLDALVDAGSASAHRGWKPTPEDLNTMMDILEQFVHDAFVVPARKKRLDAKVVKMKATVPQRTRKEKVRTKATGK